MLLIYHHNQDQYVELSKRSTGSGGIAGIVIFIFIVIVIFISLVGYGNKRSKRRNQKNTTPANITLGSLNLESQNVHQGVVRIQQQQQQQQQQNLGITTSPEHDYVPPYTQTPNDNDLGRFDKQGNFHLLNRPESVQPPLPPPPVYLNPTI